MVLKQVFIINSDLKMRAGKIGVQTAHGATQYMQHVCDHGHRAEDDKVYARYVKWFNDEDNLMKKVVLKATEMKLMNITWILKRNNIWAYPIFDRGLTQVPKDSFTCLVVEPIEEELCKELFGDLKLL